MALSIMREESSPENQAEEEARWLSQRGSGQLGMEPWNYWLGGSQGNPPTSSSSSSVLTILRPPRRPRLPGSSPSSPAAMGVITCSSRRSADSTIPPPPLRCINTALLTSSGPTSPPNSITSPMPSAPPETSSMPANTVWRADNSPTSCVTSRTRTASPLESLSLDDAIETLLASALSMTEHLPSEGGVSPPSPVPPWVQWSNELVREMYIKHVLQQLELQYPRDSIDS